MQKSKTNEPGRETGLFYLGNDRPSDCSSPGQTWTACLFIKRMVRKMVKGFFRQLKRWNDWLRELCFPDGYYEFTAASVGHSGADKDRALLNFITDSGDVVRIKIHPPQIIAVAELLASMYRIEAGREIKELDRLLQQDAQRKGHWNARLKADISDESLDAVLERTDRILADTDRLLEGVKA